MIVFIEEAWKTVEYIVLAAWQHVVVALVYEIQGGVKKGPCSSLLDRNIPSVENLLE